MVDQKDARSFSRLWDREKRGFVFLALVSTGKEPRPSFFPGWAEESAEQGKVYSHHSLSQERVLQFHQEKR